MIGIALSQASQSYELCGLYPIDDKFVEISGYVSEIPVDNDGSYRYIITCEGAKYKDKLYNLRESVVMNSDTKLEYMQNVGVRGFLKRFNRKMNYSDFDYSLYMKSKDIFYTITDYEIATDNTKRSPLYPNDFANLLKYKIHLFIDRYVDGDDAGILKAVLTGYKKEISDEFYDVLSKTGTIRFLYPAYLHIFLIFLIVDILLLFSGIKKKEKAAILLITIYAFFNMEYASIIKAALMSIAAIIALHKLGLIHFPDIISVVAIVVLVSNPLLVYNAGFVISIAMSWVLFMAGDIAYEMLSFIKNKKMRKFIGTYIITLFGFAPLAAYYFDGVAPLTGLFTFIFLPAAAVIIVMFPLMWLEIAIFSKSVIFSKGVLGGLWIMKRLPYFIESLPFSSVLMKRPSLIEIAIIYLLFVIVKEVYYKKKYTIKAQALIAIICGGILSIVIVNAASIGSADITFVNVGQGDGAVIELPKGERIIVDGGGAEEYSDYDAGEKIFVPYLKNEGYTRIDMAILSHYHKDHCLGTIAAMKKLNVHTVAIPDVMPDNEYRREIEALAREKGTELLYLERGDEITFESGAKIRVISAENASYIEENDTSVVFELEVNGFKTLFTGDATEYVENKYFEDFSDVDLLKVAHHGSLTSTSDKFLKKILPEYAVICVGENNAYALPSDSVVNRIKRQGTHILRTDIHGDICFNISKDGKVKYTTYYEE